MRCKKLVVIGILLVFLLVASCTPETGPSGEEIWEKILWFGTLGFLGDYDGGMVGFMRILIFILVFGLIYTASGAVPGLNRNVAIVVSLILSIMSVLFIPNSILIGVGAAYATIVSVILIGAPIVGGYLLFRAIPEEHRLARITVLLLLLLVLIAVKYNAWEYL